jgi:hypothetical protein
VSVKLLCKLPDRNGSVRVTGSANVCPRVDALSAEPAEVLVGESVALAAEITDSDELPAPATYEWSATEGELENPTSANPTFTCTRAGTVTVTLKVSDGDCDDGASATVTCSPNDGAPPAPPSIRVNEVESSGGSPGDWTELFNAESTSVDLSGFVFKDNDDTHAYTFPDGSVIPPGGYFVVEEAAQGFGLGSGDSARLFDPNGALVDSYTWTAHAATSYGRCPNGAGAFTTLTSVTKGAANDCSVAVKINEVESSGGTPGDWTELYNAGAAPADLSGFIFKDNDDTHAYTLPAGTVIAAGGYFVVEEAAQGFGLGGADSVRLFDRAGVLVDSYTWSAHAALTYARCPSGSGAFAASSSSTKGLENACAPVTPASFAWPGTNGAAEVDAAGQFTSNLSGLTYQPAAEGAPAVLWAVVNGPGTLFRMIESGGIWLPDSDAGWSTGKPLRYTDGTGNPDSEGVTFGAVFDSVYVATERNNDASTISRLSILRFDPSSSDGALTATHDWNVTGNLPVVGANLGLETITFVPDSFLVSKGFYDEAAGKLYDPAAYPNHGGGLFIVGVEGTGQIHAFALDHASGAFTRVATISTGNPGVMALEFDREIGYLWSMCDDTCGNKAAILDIDTAPGSSTLGRFIVRRQFDRPSTLPNVNNEGIAIAPETECSGGFKAFFWSDDNATGGHSLRRDTIPCGAFLR